MKIVDIENESRENRQRVSAKIKWEDCDRPEIKLFFETDELYGNAISPDPHAFITACIMPALYFGEKRIVIDSNICPEFCEGLMNAMSWIIHWNSKRYGQKKKPVEIVAGTKVYQMNIQDQPRAGFLLSGGVDSLSTLRLNRLKYPPEHPGSLKDGFLICGFEVNEERCFSYVKHAMSALAEDAGIELIPVYTNLRQLGPSNNSEFWGDFWINDFMGSAFAAIGHAFSKRITQFTINSCHTIPNLIPYSSNALIVQYYSSANLKIHYEGARFSRFEKVASIRDWDAALQYLRVCNQSLLYQFGALNCGKCEKCVRTMLELLALGVLEKSRAFPICDVTKQMIINSEPLVSTSFPYYQEIIEPLRKIGRYDLIFAIQRKQSEYLKPEWFKKLIAKKSKLAGYIRKIDNKYFGGTIRTLYRITKKPKFN